MAVVVNLARCEGGGKYENDAQEFWQQKHKDLPRAAMLSRNLAVLDRGRNYLVAKGSCPALIFSG
jgi:hypothetical protein